MTQGPSPIPLPSGLLGRPTPLPLPDQAWHPEALDWMNRVRANGGGVSQSTMAAVNRFCVDIDAASLRDRFYRLNLFCGSNLLACLVPLYRATTPTGAVLGNATDTNNNFVSADYVEYGEPFAGLKGNGTTKYLNTGVNPITIGMSNVDNHLSVYCRGFETVGTSRYTIANFSGATGGPSLGWLNSGSREDFVSGGTLRVTGSTRGLEGFLGGAHYASDLHPTSETPSDLTIYTQNGVVLGTLLRVLSTTLANDGLSSDAIGIFAPTRFLSGFTLARYIRGYSIGLSLRPFQWQLFNAAMQRFQAALGRNV